MASASVPQRRPNSTLEVRVGTQGFQAKPWLGAFYPPKARPESYLSTYSQIFDTVELNTTFYAVPPPSVVLGWLVKTPDDFVFTCKMPKVITEEKRLQNCGRELEQFLGIVGLLGPKLGPIVIQVPSGFTDRDLPNLEAFLPRLPKEFEFAFEPRSRRLQSQDLVDLLKEYGVALCINQWKSLPIFDEVSADFSYIRLIGYHEHPVGSEELRDRSDDLLNWAERIKNKIGKKVRRVYIYVNNHYSGYAPTTANRLKQLLGLETYEPQSIWLC